MLVFDDLHWADGALLAFLEYLAEWSHGVPLLIICAARPELYERRPGWGAGQRNMHTINLSPLSHGEMAELVSYLAGSTILVHGLEQAILERRAGTRFTPRSSCACLPTAAWGRLRIRRCRRASRR